MNYSETLSMAERLESLIRRTSKFNKSREDIVEEIGWIVSDLRRLADHYDAEMNKEYLKNI